MKHALWLAAMLALFWIALSGHYTGLLLSFGLASVLFVCWIAKRMDIFGPEAQPLLPSVRAPLYWLWLAKEIQVSALQVIRLVWGPQRGIDPRTGIVKSESLAPLLQVTFANSITLTPGTLSLSIWDDEIEVHALVPESITDLQTGRMAERIRRMGDR